MFAPPPVRSPFAVRPVRSPPPSELCLRRRSVRRLVVSLRRSPCSPVGCFAASIASPVFLLRRSLRRCFAASVAVHVVSRHRSLAAPVDLLRRSTRYVGCCARRCAHRLAAPLAEPIVSLRRSLALFSDCSRCPALLAAPVRIIFAPFLFNALTAFFERFTSRSKT